MSDGNMLTNGKMNGSEIRKILRLIKDYDYRNFDIIAYMGWNIPDEAFVDDELIFEIYQRVSECYFNINNIAFIDFDSLVLTIYEFAINPDTGKLSEYFKDQWDELTESGTSGWVYGNFEIDPYY